MKAEGKKTEGVCGGILSEQKTLYLPEIQSACFAFVNTRSIPTAAIRSVNINVNVPPVDNHEKKDGEHVPG